MHEAAAALRVHGRQEYAQAKLAVWREEGRVADLQMELEVAQRMLAARRSQLRVMRLTLSARELATLDAETA
jgi:hypothetical protein